MKLFKRVVVVGSRAFTNWDQLCSIIQTHLEEDDELVSGGSQGVDSMAQRYAKEYGHNIHIYYPKHVRNGSGSTFIRNKEMVLNSDLVLVIYAKGQFQSGGTANIAKWARELDVKLIEYAEEAQEDGWPSGLRRRS